MRNPVHLSAHRLAPLAHSHGVHCRAALRHVCGEPSRAQLRIRGRLFFEYHFFFDGRDFGWGNVDPAITADEALKLMRRLREGGVRAHFWI